MSMRIYYSLERFHLSFAVIGFLCLMNHSVQASTNCSDDFTTIKLDKKACKYEAASAFLTVSAPADITLTIPTVGGCDTIFNMPPATLGSICAPITFTQTRSVFTTLNTNGGNMYFSVGVFNVIYTFTDACGTFRDTTKVTVYDATPPKVLCIPDHAVSLNNLGEAYINASGFDGGSTDDCGHLYFKARRMFAPTSVCTNPNNPLNRFNDVVRFCCRDVDSAFIAVILRVYDADPGVGPVHDSILRRHYGECMVMVRVFDKLAPNVYCQPNITVNCGADLDSVLRLARPQIFDNCTMSRIDSSIVYKLNSCGAGTIERSYTGTDTRGQSASCTQIITVLKNNTFNGLDTNQLLWPAHTTVYACRVNADVSKTGVPRIKDNRCDLVLVNKKDDIYEFNRGGVCAKILRNWEVINWCVYNRNYTPNPNVPANGFYSYTQIIKILDTIPPVITGVADQTVGIATENCAPGFVTLTAARATDCGVTTALIYSYYVDYNNDGTIDKTGTGANPSGIYPIGIHNLCYVVEDSCSNLATKCVKLTIKDSKSPNATLMSGLSTSLTQMSAGIMVMLNAKTFNISSSDNCTKASNLRYSFSSNPNDTIRTYTCDSVGRRNLVIFVWDEAGNYTAVQTYIVVGDELGICPHTLTSIKVLGIIRTQINEMLPKINVIINFLNQNKSTITNDVGSYAFNEIPKNTAYTMFGSYSENYLDKITTADILRIQKYILGLYTFDNVYDLLAADVDQSGSVSARDISQLRSLILGKTSELSHHKSYVFISEDYKFINEAEPFQEMADQAICKMPPSAADNKINLIGIKLGDVIHNTNLNGLSERSNGIDLRYRTTTEGIEIYSPEDISFAALQFGINFQGLCFVKSGIKSEIFSEKSLHEGIFIDNNSIKFLITEPKGLAIKADKILFFIPFEYHDPNCESFTIHKNYANEWIDQQDHISIIRLSKQTEIENQYGFTIVGIQSDPFHGNMNIRIQAELEMESEIIIISADAKVVLRKTKKLNEGINDIHLQREEFAQSGIYFIKIDSKYNNEIIKINIL